MKKKHLFIGIGILILLILILVLSFSLLRKHTHEYTGVVTEPTCIEQGYTTYTCSCGDSYTDDEVEALGHLYGEWKVVKEATVDEEGLKEKECNRCNDKV